LLLRLEHPRQPALEDHLHRPTRLGPWVLIREIWYKGTSTLCRPRWNAPYVPSVPLGLAAFSRFVGLLGVG
jgi:hypothetical protein